MCASEMSRLNSGRSHSGKGFLPSGRSWRVSQTPPRDESLRGSASAIFMSPNCTRKNQANRKKRKRRRIDPSKIYDRGSRIDDQRRVRQSEPANPAPARGRRKRGGGRAAPQELLAHPGAPVRQGLPRHSHAPTLLSDQNDYRSVVSTSLPHSYVTVTTPSGWISHCFEIPLSPLSGKHDSPDSSLHSSTR